MSYLIGLIGLLFGALFYTNTKKNSANALLENNDVNKAANKVDQQVSKNDGLLEAEEEKRKALEGKKNEQDHEDSVSYFNNRDTK